MRPEFEGSPLEYAKSLKPQELKKAIAACKKGAYDEFADRCRVCFEQFAAGNIEQAAWWSNHAELVR